MPDPKRTTKKREAAAVSTQRRYHCLICKSGDKHSKRSVHMRNQHKKRMIDKSVNDPEKYAAFFQICIQNSDCAMCELDCKGK